MRYYIDKQNKIDNGNKLAIGVILAIAATTLVATNSSKLDDTTDKPVDQMLESIDFDVFEGPRSVEWHSVRNRFVAEHPVCEACGSTDQLNVHHVEPFHTNPELELQPSNLITLCREHHFRVGHDPDGPWKPSKPNWSLSNPLVREHSKLIRHGKKY